MRRARALFAVTLGRGLASAAASAMGVMVLMLITFGMWKGLSGALTEMYFLLPDELRLALEAHGAQWTTLMGYLGLVYQHPVPFTLLGMSAIGSAARAIAGEVEVGTADLLFTRPLGRGTVLAAHVAGALARLVVIAGALPTGVALGATLTHQWELVDFGPCVAAAAVLGALFACVFGYALLFSALARTVTTVYATAAGLTVTLYLTSFLAEVKPEWEPLKRVTPFGYYRVQGLLSGERPAWPDVAVLLAATAASVAAAWVVLRRRDL